MATQADNSEDLARVFHTLSNPSRLRILTALSTGEMTGATIAKELGIPATTVSMHLTRLCNGGLVNRRYDKQRVIYSLADLGEHYLGQKCEFAKRGSNAAKFGPVELVLPGK